MDFFSESYEFLDLSDIDDSERKEIIKTLYSKSQAINTQLSSQPFDTTITSTTTTSITTSSSLSEENTIPIFNKTNIDQSQIYDRKTIIIKPKRNNTTLYGPTLSTIVSPATTEQASVDSNDVQNVSRQLCNDGIIKYTRNIATTCNISNINSSSVNQVQVHQVQRNVKNHCEQQQINKATQVPSSGVLSNTNIAGAAGSDTMAHNNHSTLHHHLQSVQHQHHHASLLPTNNNGLRQYPHHNIAPSHHGFNAIQQSNVFVPTHSHQQMYPAMIPAGYPSSVFVNNVNLHGWPAHHGQPMVQSNAPQYMAGGDVPQNLQNTVDQNNSAIQPIHQVVSNQPRPHRRGRGRGGNNGGRRIDYMQRQQPGSPSPQEFVSDVEPAFQQYAYPHTYSAYFSGPPQSIGQRQTQQATGPPIFVASSVPMYPGTPVYNYHPIYPQVVHPDYPNMILDENGEERPHPEQMMWPMYQEEYVNPEMLPPSEEVNHTASVPVSFISTDTQTDDLGYQLYDPHVQHIYDHQPEDKMLEKIDGYTLAPEYQTHNAQIKPIEQPQQFIMPANKTSNDENHEQNRNGSDIPINSPNNNLVISKGTITEQVPLSTDSAIFEPLKSATNVWSTGNANCVQSINDINTNDKYANNNVIDENLNTDFNQNVPNVEITVKPMSISNLVSYVNTQSELPLCMSKIAQQQQQQQQYTKDINNLPDNANNNPMTMTRTNLQNTQMKKSTSTVAVTANPSISNKINPNGSQIKDNAIKSSNSSSASINSSGSEASLLVSNNDLERKYSNNELRTVSTTSIGSAVVPQQLQQQTIEQQIIEQQRTEQQIIEQQRAEQQRIEQVRIEQQKLEQQKLEQQKLEQQKLEQQKLDQQKLEQQKLEQQKLEQQKLEQQKLEQQKSELQKQEQNQNMQPKSLHQKQLKQQPKAHQKHQKSQKQQKQQMLQSTPTPPQQQLHPIADNKASVVVTENRPKSKKDENIHVGPPLPTKVPNAVPVTIPISVAATVPVTVPVTTPIVQAQVVSAPSWASLFDSKNTTAFTTSASSTSVNSSANSSASPQNLTKKPVAKVAPFDGSAPNSNNTTFSTTTGKPGILSYSAASAQGIPAQQAKKPAPKNAIQTKLNSSQISGEGVDEWPSKFSNFLTKWENDFTKPVSLRPRGLTNRSNYCYINSILQSLMACSPFYNMLKSIPLPKSHFASNSDIKIPTINALVQFASEFSLLSEGKCKDDIPEMQCDSAFEPSSIYKLWNATRSDVEGRQEDAEEFLGYVLNKLNDELLEAIKFVTKPAAKEPPEPVVDTDDTGDDWQIIYSNKGGSNRATILRQTDFGKTPLSDIFRGELRSRLQREGSHSTVVIQPFFTLQLNIEKSASVKEALDILVGRDQLEGVTCSKTNQEVVAWQQITIEKLPIILILHLKWFDYKSDGCSKILKTVEFPVDLKLDTKTLGSKKYNAKQRSYRLFAVVYHDGKEASKGHYITDVFHSKYSRWLRYDDSSVKPIELSSVLRPRAPRVPYLLYYQRTDTIRTESTSSK